MSTPRRLWIYLAPALALAALLISSSFLLRPVRRTVPELAAWWREPKQPVGQFKSWRRDGSAIVGESEYWPHPASRKPDLLIHPRAHAYLEYRDAVIGDWEIALTGQFLRSRYLDITVGDPATEEHALRFIIDDQGLLVEQPKSGKLLAETTIGPNEAGRLDWTISARPAGIALMWGSKIVLELPLTSVPQGRLALHLINGKVRLERLAINGQDRFGLGEN